MKISSVPWSCWRALLRLEGALFSIVLVDRLINFLIWGATIIFVSGFILPLLGMSSQYGVFAALGVLSSAGVFEAYGRMAELITQMSGNSSILYYATLPVSSAWMIVRIMLVTAVRSMLVSLALIPMAWLILGDRLDLSSLQLLHFIVMFVMINLFTGAASVWLAVNVPSILSLSNVWMRHVFPFWFLGGFQFTQYALLRVAPVVGWVNFFNPLIYATEGLRAAVLGQEGYLNIWVCLGMLMVWTSFCVWRGVVLMKRRLDLI